MASPQNLRPGAATIAVDALASGSPGSSVMTPVAELPISRSRAVSAATAAEERSPTPTAPLDTSTRLAVDRTRLAYERTLMAWVRTATALISFGFTIYKFFEFEHGRGVVSATHMLTPRQFGMVMIGTGLTALTLATFDHRRNMRRIRDEFGTGSRSVSTVVAVIVSGMGLLALIAAMVRG